MILLFLNSNTIERLRLIARSKGLSEEGTDIELTRRIYIYIEILVNREPPPYACAQRRVRSGSLRRSSMWRYAPRAAIAPCRFSARASGSCGASRALFHICLLVAGPVPAFAWEGRGVRVAAEARNGHSSVLLY